MTLDEIIGGLSALSVEERKHLVAAIFDSLTFPTEQPHNILEFEGIAAHLADDEDPQDYVNRLRQEWDNRP